MIEHDSDPSMNRRRFGITSAIATIAAAGACGLWPSDVDAEDQPAGAIDAHVHVWHPDTEKYPISKNFAKSDMQPSSFTVDELLAHTRPAGVAKIVLIQMSFYEFDHRYMLEAMQSHPGMFSGVALIDYRADDVAAKVAELAGLGMQGFRIHSHGDAAEWVKHPGISTLFKECGERGLAVCPLINPTDIGFIDALCKQYPGTTVVVDHFARIGVSGTIEPEPLAALCRLAEYPHTYVKTSAFYALGKKRSPYDDLAPMIRQVYDAFGASRLMWASDCPYQVQSPHDYASSIALIRERLDFLSASDRDWMLRATAEKVFFA